MNLYKLLKSIKAHEGLSLSAYKLHSSNGVHETFYTIGYGHKLRHHIRPITKHEAEIYLHHDILKAQNLAMKNFKRYPYYPWKIQNFLTEMYFNMGINFNTFKKANKALRRKDIPTAVKEYKDSLWAKQVGENRVNNLMQLLETSSWKT